MAISESDAGFGRRLLEVMLTERRKRKKYRKGKKRKGKNMEN